MSYALSSELEGSADLVDVLSFHDYTPTRAEVEAAYRTAEEVGKKFGKPILNTETACIARANPYEEVLQIAEEHHTGWYLFNQDFPHNFSGLPNESQFELWVRG